MHLDRLIAILELVAVAGRPVSASEIQKATGLPKPTCYRLMQTLQDQGLVDSPADDGRVVIGERLIRIALLGKSDVDVRKAAAPLLKAAAAVDEARLDVATRMRAAGQDLTGFLVEEMAAPGSELIIGGMHDPKLGPMIMIGAGGIFTEVINDTVFGLCPISRLDAEEMVENLKILPILKGARGRVTHRVVASAAA